MESHAVERMKDELLGLSHRRAGEQQPQRRKTGSV